MRVCSFDNVRALLSECVSLHGLFESLRLCFVNNFPMSTHSSATKYIGRI